MFPNDDLCSTRDAKKAARRIFQKYQSSQQSNIEQGGIFNLMRDTYKALNMNLTPQKDDVNGFFGVLDNNGDGKVNLEDLQKLAIKYLCGNDTLLGDLQLEKPEGQEKEREKEGKTWSNNSQSYKSKDGSNSQEGNRDQTQRF